MLGLIPLSLHRPLCSTEGKSVIRCGMNMSRASGVALTSGSDELSASLCRGLYWALGCPGIWCTGMGLLWLLNCAGGLFTILVSSAVRVVVSPGSRVSSSSTTACTPESGKVLSGLQVKVLAGHRVCRNHWGNCTLRQSSVTW